MPERNPRLPRKLLGKSPEAQALQAKFGLWKVDEYCAQLWAINKSLGRGDTFVGLMDTDTWRLYLAPCFGVTEDEYQAKLRDRTKWDQKGDFRERLSDSETLPDNLEVVSGSTSVERDSARKFNWIQIKGIYGKGACLVPFPAGKPKFDGFSHHTLGRWVMGNRNVKPKPAPDWQHRALGFAIQVDKAGYFVRFASGYNHGPWSQVPEENISSVFQKRTSGLSKWANFDETRDARDLPKQWAEKLVEVLARDLRMGYFKPEDHSTKFFDRMVSRDENMTTKFKRIHDLPRLT